MPVATADIDTPEASRLIKRLCTHWAHKFPVSFDADSGTVPFDATTIARLRAEGEHLHVHVEADDAVTMERFQGVVEVHLQRMARAGELAIRWQPLA
ncbi:MAG TPA: DUF2218 domain-containing protein [Luteimonas sp.]|nr:DUF2218 domain-containing protein [Luteimonas sp.]